ncbi:MAG: hypothetical protein PWP04_1713 [Candidatus Atribacteria bacterium]|nr:hypothetical protein [Candidatus Atribacteria bacterium]
MKLLDCRGKHYREVNAMVEAWWNTGERKIILERINGQRYIGRTLSGSGYIEVRGTPGDDLGMFMDGATIRVKGNAQDGAGNTMNAGKIIVEGDARDITGLSMRGGKIWIKGSVGYRAGIHMKSYEDDYPIIVVGGTTGDFLGEYMAGGLILVLGLGLDKGCSPVGKFIASGMHGGTIFIRGKLTEKQVGKGIGIEEVSEEQLREINNYLEEYSGDLKINLPDFLPKDWMRVFPLTTRPYGRLYAY